MKCWRKRAPKLKPGSDVTISVVDTGTGIPASIVNRIFEPFFSTKDVTKGTGLGLATAQGIVKSHAGLLTVISEEGKGTQFEKSTRRRFRRSRPCRSTKKPPIPRGAGEWVLVVDAS